MNNNTLWSLRLGFSNKQSKTIQNLGIKTFLDQSFNVPFDDTIPSFLDNSPKTIEDLQALKAERKLQSQEEKMQLLRREIKTNFEMKSWWIDKMQNSKLPLTEKMTLFWHNHFVATFQKIKVNHWVFYHNQMLRENAFGNFKELTKKIIKTNATIKYLDNNDNKVGKLNENLSRELLELFTLGIGNYSEEDIKNGAKGLAGLSIGLDNAVYRPRLQDDKSFQYLGKSGNFKIDEMIDIIFEQPNIPYLITRKILKWFIYDNPDEVLVKYYGDYFKKQNFEIKPLLTKIFTEEFDKKTAGSKIKNPLEYILQLSNELQIQNPKGQLLAFFLKQQNMDLFNQPNVKGWIGGNSWLTSQTYLQRNNVADLLCNGKNFPKRKKEKETEVVPEMMSENESQTDDRQIKINLEWNKSGNNKQIIEDLKDRLLFQTDSILQLDFEKILKYDFDSKTDGSQNAVIRLFNAMVKTPEFQLI
ncbi:MAG: DUF1800 domain-containing protein [Flavobacterium sp.]|nr:DUF1800 domain-containing protein [Flavobacterium sp.]